MIIEKLQLESFRNYAEMTVDLAPGINVFYGLNGQGKTNLLEAIYLCTCARSHRTARDADLIQFGSQGYRVQIRFEGRGQYQESLCLSYEQLSRDKRKRRVFHDGMQLDRIGEMMGLFHAVIFAPEDLQLLREGPAVRRRFLDLRLCQVDPQYFAALQKYGQLLQQKNRILKIQDSSSQNVLLLDVWDQQLAQEAARIVLARKRFAEEMLPLAQQAYARISSDREQFRLRYHTGFQREFEQVELALQEREEADTTWMIEELAQKILQRFLACRSEDQLRGSCSCGPHRDDVFFYMNDKPAKAVASQGQTRSMVLALKLAELAWMQEQTKEAPILLLDDVLSELDEQRRTSLLAVLKGIQVCVTCTDREQAQLFWEESTGSNISSETQSSSVELTYFAVDSGSVVRQEPQNQGV